MRKRSGWKFQDRAPYTLLHPLQAKDVDLKTIIPAAAEWAERNPFRDKSKPDDLTFWARNGLNGIGKSVAKGLGHVEALAAPEFEDEIKRLDRQAQALIRRIAGLLDALKERLESPTPASRARAA